MKKSKKLVQNEKRFRELVLYISQSYANDPKFGAMKLNKALYFCDYLVYGITGKPATGMEYQKLANGPAPRKLLPIRNNMVKRGDLGLQEVLLPDGRVMHRTVNLRAPDLSVFTASEISLIDKILYSLRPINSRILSGMTHGMMGWKIAEMKETIPYETIFVSDKPLTQFDKERAFEVAQEYGLYTG